jgi:hypothetical protein
LPTGAGEDASPLGLRPVGAAEDGQNATHGGWRCGGEEQVSAGVDEAERVRETRVLEKKREMRRLAGDRTVFIADPCGSGASRLPANSSLWRGQRDTWRLSVGRVPYAAGVYPFRMPHRRVSMGPVRTSAHGQSHHGRPISDLRQTESAGAGAGWWRMIHQWQTGSGHC